MPTARRPRSPRRTRSTPARALSLVVGSRRIARDAAVRESRPLTLEAWGVIARAVYRSRIRTVGRPTGVRGWRIPASSRYIPVHGAKACGGRGVVVGGLFGHRVGCARRFESTECPSSRSVRSLHESARAVGPNLGDQSGRMEERVRRLPRPASQDSSPRSHRPPSPSLRAANRSADRRTQSPLRGIQGVHGGQWVLRWNARLELASRFPRPLGTRRSQDRVEGLPAATKTCGDRLARAPGRTS
jgi:hypothetical protein